MRVRLHAPVLIAALAAAAAAVAAIPARAPASSCFFLSQWRGWEAPNPRQIYMHVNAHDVFRIDLAADAPMLQSVGARLVSIEAGGDSVCHPVDLDLKVSDSDGFSEPLFVKAVTKLSPDEALAVSRKRPTPHGRG